MNFNISIFEDIKHKIQFGGNTDELARKVANGGKTATSSLYDYCKLNLSDAYEVEDLASVLDSHKEEVCIVKIVKVEVMRFGDISEAFAIVEGDGSLENWLNIHTEYYSKQLKEIGKKLSPNTKLICEWFKKV